MAPCPTPIPDGYTCLIVGNDTPGDYVGFWIFMALLFMAFCGLLLSLLSGPRR